MPNLNSKFKAETVVSDETMNPAASDLATEAIEFEDNDNLLNGTSGIATLGKIVGLAYGLFDLLGSPSTRRGYKKFYGDYIPISGTWNVVSGNAVLSGTSGAATTELNNNELIIGPGGFARKVKTIGGVNQITLTKAFNANASGITLYRVPTLSERLQSLEDIPRLTGIIIGELKFNSTSLPPIVSAGTRGINKKLVKNDADIAPALADVFNKSRPILDTYCWCITCEDGNGNVKNILNTEGPVSGATGTVSSISGSGTTKTINYTSGTGATYTDKIIVVWDGSVVLFVSKITGGNGSSTHVCETATGAITGSAIQYQVYERIKTLHGTGSALAITTDANISKYTPSLGENGWPSSIFAWDDDKQGWYCTLPGLTGWRALGSWCTDGSANVIASSVISYKTGRNKNDNEILLSVGASRTGNVVNYTNIISARGCDIVLVMGSGDTMTLQRPVYWRAKKQSASRNDSTVISISLNNSTGADAADTDQAAAYSNSNSLFQIPMERRNGVDGDIIRSLNNGAFHDANTETFQINCEVI